MPKFKVGDIVYYINYIKLRIECSFVHKVDTLGGIEYTLGLWDIVRKEVNVYGSAEEATKNLKEYLVAAKIDKEV